MTDQKPSTKRKSRAGNLADGVYQALRLAIIEQALAPGTKLPEDSVGESFGVSRTVAVSYTHLDVYKRQLLCGLGEGTFGAPESPASGRRAGFDKIGNALFVFTYMVIVYTK